MVNIRGICVFTLTHFLLSATAQIQIVVEQTLTVNEPFTVTVDPRGQISSAYVLFMAQWPTAHTQTFLETSANPTSTMTRTYSGLGEAGTYIIWLEQSMDLQHGLGNTNEIKVVRPAGLDSSITPSSSLHSFQTTESDTTQGNTLPTSTSTLSTPSTSHPVPLIPTSGSAPSGIKTSTHQKILPIILPIIGGSVVVLGLIFLIFRQRRLSTNREQSHSITPFLSRTNRTHPRISIWKRVPSLASLMNARSFGPSHSKGSRESTPTLVEIENQHDMMSETAAINRSVQLTPITRFSATSRFFKEMTASCRPDGLARSSWLADTTEKSVATSSEPTILVPIRPLPRMVRHVDSGFRIPPTHSRRIARDSNIEEEQEGTAGGSVVDLPPEYASV